MSEMLTKSAARNIFYGGSLFFLAIFVGLTAHSHIYVLNTTPPVTDAVANGKHVWEKHSCINCHTIYGEGAYFAPEVGNVMTRWGVRDSPEDAFQALKGWIEAQPTGIAGRRQMPRFHLSDEDIRALSDFLIWADRTDRQGWPPNDAG